MKLEIELNMTWGEMYFDLIGDDQVTRVRINKESVRNLFNEGRLRPIPERNTFLENYYTRRYFYVTP